MSQIVDDLRQVAIEIKTETQVGGNTAARVGGAFERVADALEGTQQIEDMDAAVAAVQQAAQENEQTIQDIVNNLAVVQTTGQSTSDVMSQKAVTDEINNLSENLRDVEDSVFTLTTEDIPLTKISGKYYYYDSNEGMQTLGNSNFSCASPIDISKYIKVSLNFYMADGLFAGTYFLNENGEMVGVKMTNTTGTYKDFDVPEGAKWLYFSTRTKTQATYGARGTIRTTIKDNVAEIEEKTIIPKELSISSYPERRYIIAISTDKWTASYNDRKHILVPVGNYVKFRITGGGDNYSVYSFLKSNAAAVAKGTPDYATGYTGVKLISKGVTKDVDIPEDALYLYLSLWSIDQSSSSHYEPQALYGLNAVNDAVEDNRSRIEALEETVSLKNVHRKQVLTILANATYSSNCVLSFLACTDLHGSASSAKEFIEVKNYYSDYIDIAVHLGDSVASYFSDSFSYWDDNGMQLVWNIIGNHDSRSSGGWSGAGKEAVHNKFIAPYIDDWGVVQQDPLVDANANYYYKDFTRSSETIRVLCLDAMFTDSGDPQFSWLENKLEEAKTNGYHVVVFCHYPPKFVFTRKDCTISTVTFADAGTSSTSIPTLNTGVIDSVLRFIHDGGSFIAWFNGHRHYDELGYSKRYITPSGVIDEDGDNQDMTPDVYRIPVITFEKSSTGTYNRHEGRGLNGELSEHSFTFIVIDPVDHTVKWVRYGNNTNSWMKPKNLMCYNYNTKVIIGQG